MSLYFREIGSGSPLVLIHGLFGSSDNWFSIARILSSYFKVYLPDLRNHGKSPHYQEHTYEEMVNDLLDFFNQNSIVNASLLGHSMGGKVAMIFALKYPQRINNLIVADIAPKVYTNNNVYKNDYSEIELILEAINSIDLETVTNIKQIEDFLLQKIKTKRLVYFLLKSIRKVEYADSQYKTIKYEWAINTKVLLNSLPEIYNGMDNFSKLNPNSLIPALFLKAELSNYIQNIDYEAIMKFFPKAKITELKGTTHWLHAEKPDIFVKEIIDFIF